MSFRISINPTVLGNKPQMHININFPVTTNLVEPVDGVFFQPSGEEWIQVDKLQKLS